MSNQSKKIQITIVEAKLNPDRDIISKQNIYCMISFGGKPFKTFTIHDCGNSPVWLEGFKAEMGNDNVLKIEVFNESNISIKDHLLGSGSVDLSKIGGKNAWVDITKGDNAIGKVLIEVVPDAQATTFAEEHKQGQFSKQNIKKSQEFGVSLKDLLERPMCKEVPFEKVTKIAGTNYSRGTKLKATEKQAPIADLKEILDKAGLVEEKPEDITKIAGTKNIPPASTGKDYILDKQHSHVDKSQGDFIGKMAKKGITNLLEKESFEPAIHQDGRKIGGLKNS